MGFTVTTSSCTVKLQAEYTCSKCGNYNKQKCEIYEEYSDMEHGTSRSQSSIDRRTEKANSWADLSMNLRLRAIARELDMFSYRSAELDCRCTHCNHVEPWSKMRFVGIERFLFKLLPLPIFLCFICLTLQAFVEAIIIASITASVLITWYLFKKIRYNQLEKRIALLPIESLPTVSISIGGSEVILNPQTETRKREAKNKTHISPPQSDDNVTAKTVSDNLSDDLFCRKCGAKIMSDSLFCHKCGEEIKHI